MGLAAHCCGLADLRERSECNDLLVCVKFAQPLMATADLPHQSPRSRTGTPVTLPNWTIDAFTMALIIRVAHAVHFEHGGLRELEKVIRQPQQTSEPNWLFQAKLY